MGASIIKKANIQDIPEIIGILENRVNWLKEKRIDQWTNGMMDIRKNIIENG